MPLPAKPPIRRPERDGSLAQWLTWQSSLHPREIELGLARVGAVAAQLGLVPARVPTLTVAGTNGKGSTATLLAEIYRAAGYRVGLYTSPHLLHYNERVAVNGNHASDAELCRAFAAIEAVRGDTELTYFEFGTLAALWLFREAAVEVQVLEVGLGGRLDAVNIIDADCALVTSIGLDHQAWLGDTRADIAREKAGIFRRGRPAICGEPDVPSTLVDHAAGIGAELLQIGRDFSYEAQAQHWTWRCGEAEITALPLPGLGAAVQLRNAACALTAVARMQTRCPVEESAIRTALPALRLAARCQWIGPVLVDVAHNAEAMAVLATFLRQQRCDGRTHLVIGMLDDKPVEACWAVLREQVDAVYAADLPPPRGMDAAALVARMPGADVQCFESVAEALAAAQAQAASADRIVVAGSFLTAAAALEHLRG